MIKFPRLVLAIVFVLPTLLLAQNRSIDVIHYRFDIALNDSNKIIDGKAAISFIMKEPSNAVYFDLVKFNDSSGTGMTVTRVTNGNTDLHFTQENDGVNISFPAGAGNASEKEVAIFYRGAPAEGLIIDTNKYGRKTFFADNWPNRAHNWIPCNDHPADKASVEFLVSAPDHYDVVSNGILVEKFNIGAHIRLTHWKEELALPTKVMVIGVADFAIQLADNINCIPITSWVFPENRDSGFAQYAIAKNILPFYIDYIGPYPYRKLANVQSKTIFGGMENASNIFYYENSVLTKNMRPDKKQKPIESLFAHEIAHQWFGDEASESDWAHVWLSEGFATYIAHLYTEYRYGADSLKKEMKHDRDLITAFYKKHQAPVVDTSNKNSLMQLLNINSYEKGGWVLHMLRTRVGNEIFQKGIRAYYELYKGKNASTMDFIHVMEKVSGQSLQQFFDQWLFTSGHPILQGQWSYDATKKQMIINIRQVQKKPFRFPLELALSNGKQTVYKTIEISKSNEVVEIPLTFKPTAVFPDPNVNLLFEGTITEMKGP